jgi:hypothetical protein
MPARAVITVSRARPTSAVPTTVAANQQPCALAARVILLAVLAVIVACQVFVLRPALDRRAGVVIAGGIRPKSRLHAGYIAAECVKLVLLVVLGVFLARGAA